MSADEALPKDIDAMSFEQALAELEGIVGRLESGDVSERRSAAAKLSSLPPRLMPAGQCAISGVLMPPSWTQCLYSRKGVFETFAQPWP